MRITIYNMSLLNMNTNINFKNYILNLILSLCVAANSEASEMPMMGGKPLDYWVTSLKRGDARSRSRAAQAIGLIGPPARESIPALVTALDDPEEEVRLEVVAALKMMGRYAEPATSTLVSKFGNSSLYANGFDIIRITPSDVVVAIGEPAIPALTEALDSNDENVRFQAADVLGRIGPAAKAAVPALIREIEDPDESVRANVVDALGRIGPAARAAIPALEAALERAEFPPDGDDGHSRYARIINALAKIGAKPAPRLVRELADDDASHRMKILSLLRMYGPRARPQASLVEPMLSDNDAGIREEAARTLARIDPQGQALIAKLLTGLRDRDPIVRSESASTLSGLGPTAKAAVPALVDALKDDDPSVRTRAALALSELDPSIRDPIPELIATFRREARNDIYVAQRAARALGTFGPEARGAIPILGDFLVNRPLENKRPILDALVRIDPSGERILPWLIKALQIPDPPFRREIIKTIGDIGPAAQAAVPKLIETLQERDRDTSRVAAEALGRIGPAARAAVPALLEAFKGKEWGVSQSAAEALGRIGPAARAAVPALRESLKLKKGRSSSEEVVALIRLDPDSRATASKLASESDDFDFRAVVFGALGKINPEAEALTRLALESLDNASCPDHEELFVLDDFSKTRSTLEYLGRFGRGAESATPRLTDLMKHTDPRVRRLARETLDRINSDGDEPGEQHHGAPGGGVGSKGIQSGRRPRYLRP